MGGLICCCWRMFCCECTICDPRDDWLITSEARPGERGSGFLYKRAKNSAVWSKRYCALTDTKLIYYLERDRAVMKGEIILAGATASMSSSRSNTKKKFFFNISHPHCGVREMYAKTKNRRLQWMEKINEISTELSANAMYGKLQKQGGVRHNTWQERWCIVAGHSLDYFEQASDNQSKGSIDLLNATIKEVDLKGKFCIEITPAAGGKKKNKDKLYVFQVEKEHDRERWVACLRKAAAYRTPVPLELGDGTGAAGTGNGDVAHHDNPLHSDSGSPRSKSQSMDADDDEDGNISSFRTMSSSSFRMTNMIPTEKEGYLMKKSPALMKGWQKRYFVTNKETGDIDYYKTEADAKSGGKVEPQGTIRLRDIKVDCGLEVDDHSHEITINTVTKNVYLKAASHADALAWVTNITAWMESSAGANV